MSHCFVFGEGVYLFLLWLAEQQKAVSVSVGVQDNKGNKKRLFVLIQTLSQHHLKWSVLAKGLTPTDNIEQSSFVL